jgi:1-acyl-sn-glycerol-3-phosphate acyltransferase
MKVKQREVRFRHHFITRMIMPFIRLFIKRSFKLKIKHYKALKNKGPFVVLGNHTVNEDPIVMGLMFPFHLYYIATEQVFNLGFLSKVLNYVVNPIRKAKSVSDMETIRKTKRIVQEGGSIGIFPEGNTSINGETSTIQKSTVKLIKLLKLPVIIMNSKGFYLTHPRWAIYRKKGPTQVYIKKIITPDTYLSWTDDYLYDVLKDELYVNAFDDQVLMDTHYKGKHLAHGLEKLVFMDLDKHVPFVTYSEGNTLKSSISDFKLTYLTTGRVQMNNGDVKTLVELDKLIKKNYFNYYQSFTESLLFKENVKVNQSFINHKSDLGQFKLALHKDALVLENESLNYHWLFDEIKSIAMQGKYQIIIYMDQATYILRLDPYSSIYKYVLTYQYYKYIQSGGKSINDNDYNFGI